MINKEKVINALENCVRNGVCINCEYKEHVACKTCLMADALSLLKEQETRILDWDELEDWGNAVWFEDKDEHECYIALIANVGTYDAKFTNVEPGNVHSLVFMRDFYMKEWRCWSARPTIKQRQAVKWGDT